MRVASFNVQNLFSRVRAMNLESGSEGNKALAQYVHLSTILQEPVYTAEHKRAILTCVEGLRLNQEGDSEFVILRENRGRLLKWPHPDSPEVVAEGRGNWVGWLELKREAVNELPIEMSAKVIRDVNADVLAVMEAEDRIALVHFNEQLLTPRDASYGGIMLIDGNDERGIDVGLLTKPGYLVESMVSHVDDMEDGYRVFSRDCPEFTVRVSETVSLLLLVNHLKSRRGDKAESDALRKAQAKRVREIYDLRRSQGIDMIAVIGDLNDTPDSDPLQPLLAEGSDLCDVSDHLQFQSDGRPGTYGDGYQSGKVDYILLSPTLFERVTAGGVWRKGVWGGENGTLFPHYDEMQKKIDAASDHAAIWADVDL